MLLPLVFISAALAQSATAFNAVEGPLLTNVGSPAVVRHAVNGNNQGLLVVYEQQIGAATTACPAGTWGIGIAQSANSGNNISLSKMGFVVSPTPGSHYSCVAAHPAIVELATNTWAVYFKSEQDTTNCAVNPPAWGCDRYTGIGRFVVTYVPKQGNQAATYNISGPEPLPILRFVAQDMGYPSVTFSGGQYHMAFSQNPDIFMASSSFVSQVSAPATPIVVAAGTDEAFTPSLICPTAAGTHRLYVGGREFSPYPVISDQTVSGFSSTNLTTWTYAIGPYFSTALGDDEMRHIEMVSNSDFTQFGLFYTTPGTVGNDLYLAKTSAFNWKTLSSKRCP